MTRWMAVLAVLMGVLAMAASPPAAPGQTKVVWVAENGAEQTLTLYADGRLGNAKGQTKNYRWSWTERGLVIKFWTRRYMFVPGPGKGEFTGAQTNAKTGPAVKAKLRVQQPDGAGVLAWTEPLMDGRSPSRLELDADAAAKRIVAGKLAKDWARVASAWRKLEATETAQVKLRGQGERQTADKQRQSARVREARSKEWKFEKRTHRRIDPAYSWASFSSALSDWSTWQSRRSAAERDLGRAERALESTQDRHDRAATETRKARAAYEIAAADYGIRFWTAWRPEYQRQKAILKGQAAAAQREYAARVERDREAPAD